MPNLIPRSFFSKTCLFIIIYCTFLSLIGTSYRHEKDTPGKGELWYIDLIILINQRFVKWIWGWTMVLITPFSLFYSIKSQNFKRILERTVSPRNKNVQSQKIEYHRLLHPLIRINLLGTLIWYIFTKTKRSLYNNTGRCLLENSSKVILQARNPHSCKFLTSSSNPEKQAENLVDAYWSGFNLSGHSFMLNFSILVVMSEVWCFYQFLKIYNNPENSNSNFNSNSMKKIQKMKSFKFLKIYFYLCLAFLLSCFTMVTITYSIYHSLVEKICGTVLAMFCWQIIYFDFCQRWQNRCPYLIGGPLKIVKDKSL